MTIDRPFWIVFQPLLNMSENWLLVTCMIHEKLFKLSRPRGQNFVKNVKNRNKSFQVITPTRSNYWRKRRKIKISRPFKKKFRPLLNLSENWSLLTCITDLRRIHEKLFKLSCPQVNVNADTEDANFNCNSPPFLIKIKGGLKMRFLCEQMNKYMYYTILFLTLLGWHLVIHSFLITLQCELQSDCDELYHFSSDKFYSKYFKRLINVIKKIKSKPSKHKTLHQC